MANSWDAEQIVTRELAITLIESQFPNINIISIEPMGEGFDNTMFLVNGSYSFRFPRRQIAEELLRTEWNLLGKLTIESEIPIPKPLYLGEGTDLYPWFFVGYEYITGKVPHSFSEEQLLKMVKPLATFLKKLHSYPLAELQGIPYDEFNRLNIEMRKPRLIESITKLQQYEDIPLYKNALHYVQNIEAVTIPNQKVLTHGDLHIRNILVNKENRLVGIIDWGDTHIGHSAVDLSIVYSLFPALYRIKFFQYYGEIENSTSYLARFKAIFTLITLLSYGLDRKDNQLYEDGKRFLENSLT